MAVIERDPTDRAYLPPNQITSLGAAALARAVAGGDVSAREVVAAHIARIEAVDPRLNAVVVRCFDEATEEAAAVDRARARGEPAGPLAGVPVTIKEQFLVAGTATTFGLPKLAGLRAPADGPSVRRLRAAGAIVLGKTNVGQMLMHFESDNPVYGRTNNPWALDRTPGGSSGGEAAIIAAGGSPLGLGGDFGGSVRLPAHFCGIAGLRPTSGRLSLLDTPGGYFFDQDVVGYQPGPMARHVADLALAMEALSASPDGEADPNVPTHPWPDPAHVAVRGLRIGAYEDDGWFAASPAIRRAVREAGIALQDAGATVVPFRPPDVAEGLSLFFAAAGGDGLATLQRVLRGQPVVPQLKPFLRSASLPAPLRPLIAALMAARGRPDVALVLRSGRRCDRHEMLVLAERAAAYHLRFLAALDRDGLDALICPPLALAALTHGAGVELSAHNIGSYAILFSTLGFPAGSVPVTRVRAGEESDRPPGGPLAHLAIAVERGSAGLPVGVQVAARPWRDDVVLAVMAAIEAAVRTAPDHPRTPVM